ncbi:MAG TPA: hypothetical protein VN461_22035 [Vicinamibacteria bacterium]|jgi:hypothetical protein|nr:hypothetical protein [Vicinamibacteria bacterium]
MAVITSLRPNLSRAEAIEAFREGWGGRLGGGELRSVAEAFVPFRLYEVVVQNGSRRQRSWFALDAVAGLLDPYQFEGPPAPKELLSLETRNRPEPALDEAAGRRRLEDMLRRLVFQSGFFRVRGLEFRLERVPLDLHVPYWIGLYGTTGVRRLRVLDAVRRRFEGGKARALFEGWLTASPEAGCP